MIRIFYYRFKKNYVWLLLNLLALILLIGCCTRHPACWFWWQFQTLIGLFVITLLLVLIYGLIMLFSASYSSGYTKYGDIYHFIKPQANVAVVGFAAMLFLSRINYRALRYLNETFYFVTLVLLVVALLVAGILVLAGLRGGSSVEVSGMPFDESRLIDLQPEPQIELQELR